MVWFIHWPAGIPFGLRLELLFAPNIWVKQAVHCLICGAMHICKISHMEGNEAMMCTATSFTLECKISYPQIDFVLESVPLILDTVLFFITLSHSYLFLITTGQAQASLAHCFFCSAFIAVCTWPSTPNHLIDWGLGMIIILFKYFHKICSI